MNMGFGNDRYILSAILDMVAEYGILTIDELVEKLKKFSFDEEHIRRLLNRYEFENAINLADIDKTLSNVTTCPPPIVVTYPAYDNLGISNKIGPNGCISTIREELSNMIASATNKIDILSPYIELDGIIFFEEVLCRKIQKGINVNMVVREFEQESPRKEKIIYWIESNLKNFSNFKLYNYHYVLESGRIGSTCHAKIVTVDDRIAYVGSADIRKRAFELNFEMGTIHTGYVAKKISSILKEIIDVSEEYYIG